MRRMIIVYLTSPKTQALEVMVGDRVSVWICVVLTKYITTEENGREVVWRAWIGAEVVVKLARIRGMLNGPAILVGAKDE